jgi:hypothetical protein
MNRTAQLLLGSAAIVVSSAGAQAVDLPTWKSTQARLGAGMLDPSIIVQVAVALL